jgi:hypothetical protein
MNHAKRNPGIPKRPNPQKNAKVVLAPKRDRTPTPPRLKGRAKRGASKAKAGGSE